MKHETDSIIVLKPLKDDMPLCKNQYCNYLERDAIQFDRHQCCGGICCLHLQGIRVLVLKFPVFRPQISHLHKNISEAGDTSVWMTDFLDRV
jgi:hypothetical protein